MYVRKCMCAINLLRCFFSCRIQYVPWNGHSCVCVFGNLPNIFQNVLRYCGVWSSPRPVHHASLPVLPVLETRGNQTSLVKS